MPRAGGRLLLLHDVVCRRCGTKVHKSHADKVDKVVGWWDCDLMLVDSAMES